MRPLILAALVVLAAAAPLAAVTAQQIPPADQWRDDPTLAPSVIGPQTRAAMNAEIVLAIRAANGDQAAARAAIQQIVTRYEAQTAAARQEIPEARVRPGPIATKPPANG